MFDKHRKNQMDSNQNDSSVELSSKIIENKKNTEWNYYLIIGINNY